MLEDDLGRGTEVAGGADKGDDDVVGDVHSVNEDVFALFEGGGKTRE
jgi:hypothetical protein